MRTYFALAFAVSWVGVLFVVGPAGIPTTIEHLMTIGPAMYVAMLAGPSVAGLLMTSLVSGRAGCARCSRGRFYDRAHCGP